MNHVSAGLVKNINDVVEPYKRINIQEISNVAIKAVRIIFFFDLKI